MANDTDTLSAIKVVLRQFLTEEQIDPIAEEMLSAFHGPWFPQHEKQVIPGDSYIFRLKGSTTARKLGGIVGSTRVLAGNDENGWTPIVIHAWMATHLLK